MNRTDADMQAAIARRENQRFNVTLQTKNFFFNAFRQTDLLEVARQRVEQAQQNLKICACSFAGWPSNHLRFPACTTGSCKR
ncbi:MAG: hypothetical protein CM1200mP14_01290 [Gammaproteobacteria bacterium]|nr:MAG: hypothetical protein CM1200mP14_01290 [Gammaproteobacteria bacterium]